MSYSTDAYEKEAMWSGHGEENCTDPKLLLEAIVAKIENIMPFIEIKYYDANPEKTTETELKSIWTTYDGTDGRCYSLSPTMKMIKRGIRQIEMTFKALGKIYIHTPGIYATARQETQIKNQMGRKSTVQVEHELFYMMDDGGEPCIEDPAYNKDLCTYDAFEKSVEKYGCTTPFGLIKENICIGNKNDNTTEVMKMHTKWFDDKNVHDDSNCANPCHIILTRASDVPEGKKKIDEGTSIIKLAFKYRVKMVNDYHLYSGLSLLAEIGGYFGLFLGISINQVTNVISIFHESILKYCTQIKN